ncbi:hypothetical protein MXB_3923 [Myxobolus squamalis]|nr:hypothetical protein MXB_3923 [Myxobolus squamalis]
MPLRILSPCSLIELDKRTDKYESHIHDVITYLEKLFPDYAFSLEKGGRPQQDANELFMRIIDIFMKNLTFQSNQQSSKTRNMIETMFGLDVQKDILRFKCLEEGGDPVKTISETDLQLNCFISAETKFLLDGIKSKFHEVITMNSGLLDRDAQFEINTLITRLPVYLCVQFVRFYYKEQEKVNAKILKDVKFPARLDLTELCSPELKEKLRPMQEQVRDFENKLSIANNELSPKILLKRQASGHVSLPEQELGFGDSGCGIYELIGVITHQGRMTSSGHYVAWIKIDNSKWAKLDDSVVTMVPESEILKLSGGGESHSAYLLLYNAVKVPKI